MKLKHEAVADALADQIRTGLHGSGARLPGEHELAKRFATSRTTVRLALAKLHDVELITTAPGRGSYVTYDGRPLDDKVGWGRALAREGIGLLVELLRIELIKDEGLADRLQLPSPEVIAVDRIRRTAQGTAVSLERSRVPAVGRLRKLPVSGLHGGSLQKTLQDAGRLPHRGEEMVEVAYLGAQDAELLGRPAGVAFLHTRRTAWARSGRWVEQVESLLDPEHFRLRFQLGGGR